MEVEIHAEVFNPAYLPYLNDTTETQVFFGGSSSGKSYFLAERAVLNILQGERNYLICRKVGSYVGKSVWVEIVNVIREWGLTALFSFNKSDRVITCKNGKQIIFTGLDEPEKLKSIRAENGPITDIWIEEATEVVLSDIKQLEKRQRGGSNRVQKRLTLSFNPIYQEHWLYKHYFSQIGWSSDQKEYRSPKLSILKTTYKDNHFLTEQDIERLESETDSYYYNVYTLGNWGVLGNVIFTNWRVEDLSGMRDQFTDRSPGLDFGFADDPAGVSCAHYDKKRKILYIYDEMYETDLTNDILAIQTRELVGDDRVICDSSEPKSIRELRQNGLNAVAAKKGSDSVTFGIQWMQQQTIIVDKKCIHHQNELTVYKWKEGGDGKPVHPLKPIDRDNHLIDARRYGNEAWAEKGQGVGSWRRK